jgi:hypothetical protein
VPALGGKAWFLPTLALLSLASASCDFGDEGSKESSAAQSEAVPERVEIQSSLDGLSILPRRIAWNVTTSLTG